MTISVCVVNCTICITVWAFFIDATARQSTPTKNVLVPGRLVPSNVVPVRELQASCMAACVLRRASPRAPTVGKCWARCPKSFGSCEATAPHLHILSRVRQVLSSHCRPTVSPLRCKEPAFRGGRRRALTAASVRTTTGRQPTEQRSVHVSLFDCVRPRSWPLPITEMWRNRRDFNRN